MALAQFWNAKHEFKGKTANETKKTKVHMGGEELVKGQVRTAKGGEGMEA